MRTYTTHLRFTPAAVLAMAAVLVALAALLTGCSATNSGASSTRGSLASQVQTGPVDDVELIVSVHQNAPAVDALPAQLEPLITSAVKAGAPLSVIALDGDPTVVAHLAGYTIDTSNPQAEQNDLNTVINALGQAVHTAKASADGDNLSDALAKAANQITADGAHHAAVIVIDSGLADTGYPNMTTPGITGTDPADIVEFAKAHSEIPVMPEGTTVYLVGFGYTVRPQPALSSVQREDVVRIWTSLLSAGGTRVVNLPIPRTGLGPKTAYTTRIAQPLAMPAFQVQQGPGNQLQATLSGDVLFNTGQSALRPDAEATLQQLLEVVKSHTGQVMVAGYTDTTGIAAANTVLSQQRANAVEAWLTRNGIPTSRISAVGEGEDGPSADQATAAQLQAARKVIVTISS